MYTHKIVEELPDISVLDKNTIYIESESTFPWRAAFICPCGCNALIQLSLIQDAKPKWAIIWEPDSTISITPSIRRTTGCMSHFSINHGVVAWD